jgi:hypothetical protein
MGLRCAIREEDGNLLSSVEQQKHGRDISKGRESVENMWLERLIASFMLP